MSVRLRAPLAPALLAAAAVAMLSAAFALASTGVYYDDDLAHYMIARFAWRHPELFLNTWGRPSFTILYAPAAALGFVPARLFSALLAGATALAAAYLAHLHGVQRGWLAALLTGAQPELLRQGFSTLTELVFALLLVLCLIAARRARWAGLALAAGWLPLARYESLPLVAVFGVLLLLKGQWRLLPLLALPLLIQNSFYALREGNPALLLFPLDQALGVRASAPHFDYGTGAPLSYLHRAPLAYGPAIFALACLGMARARPGLLQISVLTMLAVLSLTYWLLPGAGVAGYIRHLAMVAPAVGVLAAIGLERIAAPIAQASAPGWLIPLLGVGLALWLGMRTMYAGALIAAAGAVLPAVPRAAPRVAEATALALGALAVVTAVLPVRPFQLVEEQQSAIAAGQWLRESPYGTRFTLGSHIWQQYAAGLDPYDPARFRGITPAEVEAAPPGTVIVWDSHYSHRLVWNTPLALLQDPRRFRLLKAWEQPTFQLYIFEKTAP